MARRMGAWDCPSCGTKRITGTDDHCSGCGAPKPANVKYYLPSDAQVITDQRSLANTGQPDWNCSKCGVANEFNRFSCKSCGAAKENSQSQKKVTYGLGQVPTTSEEVNALLEKELRAQSSSAPSQTRYSTPPTVDETRPFALPEVSTRTLGIAGGVGAVLLLFGLLIWALTPRSVQLTVQAMSWERTIYLEQYQAIRQEGWSLPGDARNVSQEERLQGHREVFDHYVTKTRQESRQVPDGYKTVYYTEREAVGSEDYVCGTVDNGDGTFDDRYCSRTIYESVEKSRQEPKYRTEYYDVEYQDPVYRKDPVYATWYSYDVDRWVASRTLPASGNSNEAYWPQYSLNASERESQRTERYIVVFVDDEGKTYPPFEPGYDTWQAMYIGQQVEGMVNNLGLVSEIK